MTRFLTQIIAAICVVLACSMASAFQIERPAAHIVLWGDGDALAAPRGLNAHSIALGDTSVCVVGPNGQLSCFGCHDSYTDWGQCDTAHYAACDADPKRCDDVVLGIRRQLPAPAVAVSSSRAQSCQVIPGGIVQCWGCRPDEYQGQCEAPKQYRTGIPANLEAAEGLLLTGWYHSCFLDGDGKARCFGCADDDIDHGQCSPPAGLPALRSLAGEGAVSCGIAVSGMVECWGLDRFGQLDVPEGLIAVDLAVGPHHACAVEAETGVVKCWGCQSEYRGAVTDQGQCTPPQGLKAQRVEAGRAGSCALDLDGKVVCWGCANSATGDCAVPRMFAGQTVTDIAMGGDRIAALVVSSDPDFRASLEQQRAVAQVQLQGQQDKQLEERSAALARINATARQNQMLAQQTADYINHIGMAFRTIPAGTSWVGTCALTADAEQRLQASGKQPWEVTTTAADGIDCPPGMVPDPMAWGNEYPAHQREFQHAFQMGVFEVTLGQYRAFLEQSGTDPHPFFDKSNALGRDDHPVVWVNQPEAIAFADWLNATKPETDRGTYRLPSEGEWEYAARGPGGVTRFPWGEQMEAGRSNCAPGFCQDDLADTHPVGGLPHGPFGLHGMIGNVDEWVLDCMSDDHTTTPRDASAHVAEDCPFIIAKGGSWKYPIGEMRISYRDYYPAEGRTKEQGFRLVRELAPME